jgi:hypothetical protein
MSAPSVSQLPLLERQSIVIVPDAVLDADHDLYLRERDSEKLNTRPWPWAKFKAKERDRALHAVAEAYEDGVQLLPVRASEASDLVLPVGHPLPATVYVASPAQPMRYYPAADFHRRVFEHKFAEAIRLVMALGAIDFRVHWERGWRDNLAVDAERSVKKLAGVRGEVHGSRSRDQELLFEGTMIPSEPRLPQDLVWYHHEPTWQAIGASRLENNLRELKLFVRSAENYNIDAMFEAKLLRRKVLGLGGEFTKHVETTWRIEGTFGEPPKRRRW